MYDRILVPLDGSPPSERGLGEALRLAAEFNATLLLLHVVDDCPRLLELAPAVNYLQTMDRIRREGQELLDAARRVAEQAGVTVETLVREVSQERIADAIVDVARKNRCSLIVMGTHGRRGLDRVAIGSDAEGVLRCSPVPVLLLRHQAPKGG